MAASATYGLTHLAIAVADINRTLDFYQQVFDMQVMYREDSFLQLTTPGSNDILVFEKKQNPSMGKSGGIAHFGFRLKDPSGIDEILKKLNAAGATILDQGEFVPGSPYVFFTDPDGYEIEVWYERLEQGTDEQGTGNR
jgi:catechol 2,3-dioxygenase-like lactoylglutathione lyase family enzyme